MWILSLFGSKEEACCPWGFQIHEIFSDVKVSRCEWYHTNRSCSFLWWLQTASGGWSLVHRWLGLERGSAGINPCEAFGLYVQVPQGRVSQETRGGGGCCSVLGGPLAATRTWITLA